jgi:hypothetical protein
MLKFLNCLFNFQRGLQKPEATTANDCQSFHFLDGEWLWHLPLSNFQSAEFVALSGLHS